MTFRMLADALNDAFARWDRSHLHAFTLADGTRITLKGPWDEDFGVPELDDSRETLSRLSLGEQFTYEFDFGDRWMHLCTVGDEKVEPYEVYGEPPDRPVAYFGWGAIPDQYGRQWDGDDGESPPPPPPEPPLSDLPELHMTASSAHRATPVELDELASQLDGPTEYDEGWMLEIATGQLWPSDPEGIAGIEQPAGSDDPDAFVAGVEQLAGTRRSGEQCRRRG